MVRNPYVIVGAGMAAHANVQGARSVDAEGALAVTGGEPLPPYKQPPLSKGLWRDPGGPGRLVDRSRNRAAGRGDRTRPSPSTREPPAQETVAGEEPVP